MPTARVRRFHGIGQVAQGLPQGGELAIRAVLQPVERDHPSQLPPGQYIWLTVRNTGTGMDAATLARAIEPFFSTRGEGKGTGLGLSMVHGLAAQQGGALTLESTPGVGTSIVLWLPLSASAVLPALAEGSRMPKLRQSALAPCC